MGARDIRYGLSKKYSISIVGQKINLWVIFFEVNIRTIFTLYSPIVES